MLPLKRINYVAPMLAAALLVVILLSGQVSLPSISNSIPVDQITTAVDSIGSRTKSAFTSLLAAYAEWDASVGCARFRAKWAHAPNSSTPSSSSIQSPRDTCAGLRLNHVNVFVKGWTWIPDEMEGVYPCRCGLSCVWTKSVALVDRPDALFFESVTPPLTRRKGDPLRVYLELEASRKPSGFEDIFVGYHADDDIQVTYAGKTFHISRSYSVSTQKRKDILVYWSSSRCLVDRDQLAESFLSLVPYHSFGKCLNNVGGADMALSLYPHCSKKDKTVPQWWDHLHCAMSHYKFVLAIENTKTESYVTEKLFYALEAGAVPIYFGAPNVWDFIPPNSIIEGSKFSSLEDLASYVEALANDPVAYAEFHAWRRCGVLGSYARAREASLDTLPCRLCELVSQKGGRSANIS